MQPFALGGKQRTYDKRDYQHASLLGSGIPTPLSYSSTIPIIYNQAKFGTCGAHAGAMLANILFNAVTSPKYLWKQIKQIDGYGLNDGTDMRSIFKALQNTGICDYSLLPNPDDYNLTTIEQYSNIAEITPIMTANALTRKISGYAFTNTPTLQQIKDAIYQFKAVLLLVDCGDGWWIPSWAKKNVSPLHVGTFVGHHFICATAFGFTFVDGPNSWSLAWSDDGMFDFLEEYTPHILEMGTATVSPITNQYLFTQNMYFGLASPDVHALQIRLGVTPQTGFFGTKTLSAVFHYQLKNDIAPTGFVGPITRAKLNS